MIPEENEAETRIFLDEVRALHNAYAQSTDENRSDQLVDWMKQILSPLVEAKIPEALWLKCALPKSPDKSLSEQEFEKVYWTEVREAAIAGSTDAKFALACELDYAEDTIEESAALFREAALADHAYSQWCHGLNLLAGRGCKKDQEAGIRYIELAADKKFEGAIQWMANTLALGIYGFQRDDEEAARWQKMLAHKDMISY